jgi:FkbM family methyltransferase
MSIVSTQHGRMHIIDSDKVVSHALSLYGEWAMDEIMLLSRLILPGMCVLDIGAFIGTHSLSFSKFVGEKGQVYSFEPRKEIFSILSKNLSINDCKNVIALNLALADRKRNLDLQSMNLNGFMNFGGLSLEGNVAALNSDTYEINISTIDSLDIKKIDIIKIDVEGMERSVLNGAVEKILRDRPIIFCECNSLTSGYEIIEFCHSCEYDVHGFLASAYNPENFNGTEENIFGIAKELALLLTPREKSDKILDGIRDITLLPINNLEDLVLPLLHKPQYAYEVLASTATYLYLGINFPSPAVVEREGEIVNLGKVIAERDAEIASIHRIITERDAEIASIHRIIAERDEEIIRIKHCMNERDVSIAESQQIIFARDAHIRTLVNSKSWFVTKPIRWIARIARGDFFSAMAPVKRILHLSRSADLSPQVDSALSSHQGNSDLITELPIVPTHPVAVILPVYRGVSMTERCILAAMPGILAISSSRIVIINDASPDAGMQDMLEKLAARWPDVVTVLSNEKNLGFVKTVNRGFAYFSQHDAILLNSDVLVPQDWLSRMINEAYLRADIGTVTPFSNNATICSFPNFLQENFQPFNLDVDSIDSIFRQIKLPCIKSPTGIGFCMYIRRECLDKIGYLNEEKFGRGYGEENDFCQRALKRGWLNIISPNIYAYHEGGVSFTSEKQALLDRAMSVLDDLHPNYHADVQAFVKKDPVNSARIGRYVQLLSTIPVPKVLHVSHSVGGGVAQHVNELAQYFGKNIAHIILAPHGADAVSISLRAEQHSDKLIFPVPSAYGEMVSLLKTMGVSAVHFHHTHGLNAILLRLPDDLGVSHIFTVHDYYWLNANPTLTDEKGKYPGYYSDSLKNPLYPLPPMMTPANWQQQFRSLIEGANCVIFPSNASKSIFDNVFKVNNAVVVPHVEAQLIIDREPSEFSKKDCYVVGVLGAISREKGADVLEELAEKASDLGLPVKFKLIGYAYRLLKAIETSGPYKADALVEIMRKNELDVVFFPAQWPETYSYTLSHALDSGLPIIAPSIGAFPERLSGRKNTLLFDHLCSTSELLDQCSEFINNMKKGIPVTAKIFDKDNSKHNFYDRDYIKIVSHNLKVIEKSESFPFNFDSTQILIRSAYKKNSWRDFLVGGLWRLYMNPKMRWIGNAIPYGVRRAVKRSLSRDAIHDIANGK